MLAVFILWFFLISHATVWNIFIQFTFMKVYVMSSCCFVLQRGGEYLWQGKHPPLSLTME